MRFTLMPLCLPVSIVFSLAFGVHWLMTKEHDRGFSWTLTIGSALAGILAIALYVWTVDDRIRELESKIERLTKPNTDGESGHRPS